MQSDPRLTAEQLFFKLKRITKEHGSLVYPLNLCEEMMPVIHEINRLKKEQNAVILTHYYVRPEIIYSVGDYVGDSYALSKTAAQTDADKIIFVAVRFMAETAKILNPNKEVLLPAQDPGCTLADSIDGEKVRALRHQFPDHTFVCYINTTAEVKAECDVCVTSGNIFQVVSRLSNDKIYFLPDKNMGQNLIHYLKKQQINKTVDVYQCGVCEPHDEITLAQLTKLREIQPGIAVLSHPECRSQVCDASDFTGSTAQMIEFIKNSDKPDYLILTESGLVDGLKVEFPKKNIHGFPLHCDFMKSSTLENVLDVLLKPQTKQIIQVAADIQIRAKSCIERMFEYTS